MNRSVEASSSVPYRRDKLRARDHASHQLWVTITLAVAALAALLASVALAP